MISRVFGSMRDAIPDRLEYSSEVSRLDATSKLRQQI